MTYHTHNPSFWTRWLRQHPQLPIHLPRLLLADKHQPKFVRRCRLTQETISLLRLLDWSNLPASFATRKQGERFVPLAAYIGAYLVRLEQNLSTVGAIRPFLRNHPGLVWALGFPMLSSRHKMTAFNIEYSLPSQRHFTKKLSSIPNDCLQGLLTGQVDWFTHKLGGTFGQIVSIDTKHIIGWVKENNPKAYIQNGRFHKDQQPAGDKDCKVGCKRRRNQQTPKKDGQPVAERVSIGEFFWGYASGIVVTKVPDVGEFVLAEFTQTFDHGDSTYFLPLMTSVEERLGFRPPFGTADAAFDNFYIHDYFHNGGNGGFAAIPLRQMKGGTRQFDENGLPLCEAGLAMPLKSVFTNRTSFVQHQRGRYVCPLLHPEKTADACPVGHAKWPTGGCRTVMPTSPGARIRYQIDRSSQDYKEIYKQRTATERVFSQAVNLGIERPKLRNKRSIVNQNTLTYLLINLRGMQRAERFLG